MNAQCLIKACNTEQRLFSNEIIEALKAIHEVSSMRKNNVYISC